METIIKKIILSLLLAILCESSIFAQDSTLGNSEQINKYNFSQFGNETWNFIKQPTKWDGGDWFKIGIISAGTFLILKLPINLFAM